MAERSQIVLACVFALYNATSIGIVSKLITLSDTPRMTSRLVMHNPNHQERPKKAPLRLMPVVPT